MRFVPVIVIFLAMALPVAATADLEKRAKALEGRIMAPCCMANPVSEHYSPAAEEARRTIRAMLAAGKTEDEILAFYVAEHGEQILAMPEARGFNLAPYLLPSFMILFAAAGVIWALRTWHAKRPEPVASAPVPPADDEYAKRLQKELDDLD